MNLNRSKVLTGLQKLALRSLITPVVLSLFVPAIAHSEVLFEESFDDSPDWVSGVDSGAPQDWHITRVDELWAPSTGHPDRHQTIEISSATVAENPNRARGGTGKAFVSWRESYDPGWKKWNSDGLMFYRLPEGGLRNIYVEFWINFSNEAVATYYLHGTGASKLFRVMSHDFPDDLNNGEYFGFFKDNHKPMYIWGWGGGTEYGIRNKLSIYRGADENDLNSTIQNFPQYASFNNGDMSLWFGEQALQGQAIGGGNPTLTDYKNGGVITGENVHVDQVFGDETVWVKVGQYLEMNSAPGVPDGKLYQYINDQRILKGEGITWQTVSQPANKLWNLVGIGGNDFFRSYPNSDRYEEWYAIDDIVIRSDLPERLKTDSYVSPPKPPSNISIE